MNSLSPILLFLLVVLGGREETKGEATQNSTLPDRSGSLFTNAVLY